MLISLSRQTKFNSIRFGCEHNASESQPHSTMLRVQLKLAARSPTRASQSVELALSRSLSQSLSHVHSLRADRAKQQPARQWPLSLSLSLSASVGAWQMLLPALAPSLSLSLTRTLSGQRRCVCECLCVGRLKSFC